MDTHARAAIVAAEQACNVAFKRMEDRLTPPAVESDEPARVEVVVDKNESN
jgi:hypothetical protein